ncbi:MAG: hypothetical protein KDD63_26775 [Bacteroidetes bacterium]|nr:hypothetical protein [Bacteroidota bacterium]
MKNSILYIAFSLMAIHTFPQDTTYLDAFWVSAPKIDATYYRLFSEENGQWVERDYFIKNDQVQSQSFYKNRGKSKIIGAQTWWYENGQMSQRIPFEKGKRDGLAESWYENGQLEAKGLWKNNEKEGIWQYWYPGGAKKLEVDYTGDIKPLNFWLENGEQTLANGNGKIMEYYASGEKKYEGSVEDYHRTGNWKVFYPGGQMMESVIFEIDMTTGLHQYWYENGQLEYTGQRKDGKKTGEWHFYTEEGELAYTEYTNIQSPLFQAEYTLGNRPPVPLNMDKISKEIGFSNEALIGFQEGYIRVKVFIDKKGNYQKHKVVATGGYRFAQNMIEQHIHKVRFVPSIKNFEHTEGWVDMPFYFFRF